MAMSMTGFGRGESEQDGRRFIVEMKSVNHRYFDVNIRMPKSLSQFDAGIRSLMKQQIHRGKIDVFITVEQTQPQGGQLRYDRELARQYLDYYRQIAEDFGLENDMRVSTLGRCPDVFTIEEPQEDMEAIWQTLSEAIIAACDQMRVSRESEGSALTGDLSGKLSGLLGKVILIEQRYPQIIDEYRQKLTSRVRELLDDHQIDENRLAQELVLFSDKLCTDEETVRLRGHIENMMRTLEQEGEIGRRLDFIAQEMNREANTILSKSNDLETSNIAIDLKTEIEKIREQIQNIE